MVLPWSSYCFCRSNRNTSPVLYGSRTAMIMNNVPRTKWGSIGSDLILHLIKPSCSCHRDTQRDRTIPADTKGVFVSYGNKPYNTRCHAFALVVFKYFHLISCYILGSVLFFDKLTKNIYFFKYDIFNIYLFFYF